MTNYFLWLTFPITLSKIIPPSLLDDYDIQLLSILKEITTIQCIPSFPRSTKLEGNVINISVKETIKLLSKTIKYIKYNDNIVVVKNDLFQITKSIFSIMRTIYESLNDCLDGCNRHSKEQVKFFTLLKTYIEKQQIVLYQVSNNWLT